MELCQLHVRRFFAARKDAPVQTAPFVRTAPSIQSAGNCHRYGKVQGAPAELGGRTMRKILFRLLCFFLGWRLTGWEFFLWQLSASRDGPEDPDDPNGGLRTSACEAQIVFMQVIQ